MVSVNVKITGRVQGVFFRVSTQRQAQQLGIVGYARNCEDGSVEVVATGTESSVQQLLSWLAHGPELAQVEQLQWGYIELVEFVEFKTI